MPILSYRDIGLSGLAAAVPETEIDNLAPSDCFPPEHTASVVDKTGIRYRRQTAAGQCASDLCVAAADQLLNQMAIDRDSVDALIFVSQTPDYRMPATAVLLQDRLKLKKATGAFDVNLGCSGFVYGLNLAYSLAANPGIQRVLLLNGETRTRAYSMRDRATGLLFGDAGTAALVEKMPVGPAWFSMNSDGGRGDLICIRHGGYRHPSTPDSLLEREQADGSIRSDEQGEMNGAGVFEFLIEEVPKDIRAILATAGMEVGLFDYFVFHQANKFMNEHLRRKMKIPPEKMPYSLESFGNTSGVSVPLTMATRLAEPLAQAAQQLFLCGFGVGLSWASAIVPTQPMVVPALIEV